MRIAFRTDASSQIGTGHFMRCLTLADALKQRGAQIRFISRHLPEHLRGMLVEKGHEFAHLDSPWKAATLDELAHAKWLGVSQAQDAADSIQALSDGALDWLIVDHYALDSRWESMLRKTAKKILVIDDIADRQHDCDLLLDQNLYADMEARYIGMVPVHCRLLLGPRYALLRDEFRQLHEQIKPRTGPVKRVFVFFGGVDADNFTGRVVETLSEMDISGLHIDVVVGTQHSCREQIKAACAQHGFICHVQTDKMAELMAAADLAIGAGGAATWERIYLGLPALVRVAAHNQQEALGFLVTSGYVDIWSDNHELVKLLHDRLISNIQLAPFDIRFGTYEVAESIVPSSSIVSFCVQHVRLTYKWLLSSQLREEFLLASAPSGKQHCSYWRSVLNDPTQNVFAINFKGEHVGNCGLKYVDRENRCAEMWIYIGDSSVRGVGLGTNVMRLLEDEARRIISNGRLFLHVGKSNTAAIKLYLKAGFKIANSLTGKHWGARASEVMCMEKML